MVNRKSNKPAHAATIRRRQPKLLTGQDVNLGNGGTRGEAKAGGLVGRQQKAAAPNRATGSL